jgi:8-hydroxy-5-deazaflavin:NADPH oxidoreductase
MSETTKENRKMNVTIIGSGNMARGIGTRLVSGGNSVTLVARNLEPAGELAGSLQEAARSGATAQIRPVGSEIRDEVVVLAVPYSEVEAVIRQNKAQLTGKIIVDATNPLNSTYDGLVTPPDSSAAEEIARIAPAGARVIKAFNTLFSGTLVPGEIAGQPLDVFIAGDDTDAKATISELVTAGGLRAIDAGPLQRARQLEGLAFLGITLQFTLGTGFMTSWKLLP